MKRIFTLMLATLLLGLLGCQGTPPTPTTTPPTTHTPTAATTTTATAQPPTVRPTRQPTATSSPRPTQGPTSTPTPRPTPAPTATPTPFPITPLPGATGQIVFGAYPCSGPDKTVCGPFPGMEEYFGLYVINADGTGLRPITDDELCARDLLTRLPYVPEAWVKQAEEAGHFERQGNVLSLFSHETIRWLPDGSAWLEPGKDGLYLIQADGSGATRLVEGKIYYYGLSPDGQLVAYVRMDENAIYVTEVSSGSSRQVAQLQMPDGADVVWSPTGEQILVSLPREGISRPADLYLIVDPTAETPQIQHVFHSEDDEWLLDPQWAPDGQTIYFVLCKERHTNSLISFHVKNKEQHLLARVQSGCIDEVVWSPSGTQVGFSPSLHILDLETKQRQRILYGYALLGPMLWLPESQN